MPESVAAMSALVFALSWWLGLYLLARDPRKPVLVLAAIGLTSFAAWSRWMPFASRARRTRPC